VKIILCTAPPQGAAKLARTLLDEKLIGCCNILPGVRSLYVWEGAVQDEREELMLMESTDALVDRAMSRLEELHPYSVPKVTSISADSVNAPYLKWLGEVLAGNPHV
jgi:periplasmic divalent cation tolerance protein